MVDTETPVVSVITPIFNGARFLKRVTSSVRMQEGVKYEHILIDDCSTDKSASIISTLADGDPRIKVIFQPENGGPILARNAGIRAARGKYLAFLDADDVWLPGKLKTQVDYMEQTGAALTFTDYRFISEDGRLVGSLLKGPNEVDIDIHYRTRSGLGCLTIMLNREKVPNFYFPISNTIADKAEDFIAWSHVIKAHGPALRVPYDLARYSVVIGSRSSNTKVKAKALWTVYREIERLPLPIASYYFLCFAIAAFVKRKFFRPQFSLDKIDGSLGSAWLDCIKTIR